MKMTDIIIPPAALEAGARAAHDLWRKQASAGDDISEYEQWDDLSRFYKDELRDQARAAFIAIVEAWPGMYIGTDYLTADTQIKLPLPPQENSDE